MQVPFFHWGRSTSRDRVHDTLPSDHARRFPTSPPLPQPGVTVTGDFFVNGTVSRVICRIEQTQASRLRLRVVAEFGHVSLMGLKAGTRGHMEFDNYVSPLHVMRVHLPFVDVAAFPHQARPAHRQLLRVPATFFVRLRRKGSNGLWISGQGIDISPGGCHFTLAPPVVPQTGDTYDLDMLMRLPNGREERPFFTTAVRWVRPTSRNIYIGMEVHPTQRKTLATATVQFQHSLSRRHRALY